LGRPRGHQEGYLRRRRDLIHNTDAAGSGRSMAASRCRFGATALMSEMGQSRHFADPLMTSGLPREADIVTDGWHVSKVPISDSRAAAKHSLFDLALETVEECN
jgi:hypothetical protein